jgi:hypothetical protein
MYYILEVFCHVKNNELQALGGMNMLWYRDLAELSSVSRSPLYSREVVPSQSAQLANYEQKQIMGKAI